MIETEDRGSVRVLRLAHGKVSALDVELADALAGSVDDLATSSASAGVIVGAGAVFSAGVDLFRVMEGGPAYVERFIPALDHCFRALFCSPRPIVAAVNGHAIAGGCVLACACDHRVMARGEGKIGIPELVVGVPFPGLAIEIMRAALPAPQFEEAVFTGAIHSPEQALRRGFVHELAEPAELLDRAIEIARQLGTIPRAAFSLTKTAVRAPFLTNAARLAESDRQTVEVWKQPETAETIRAYLERTLGKKKSS